MKQSFGWDETKRRSNLKKHGIDFADVDLAFDDPGAVIEEDTSEDYGEARFKIVAVLGDQLLAIVFTERDDIIRIISARPATQREKVKYASSQNYSS
jgi:uncharacterized DUF497 family protein